MPPPCTDRSLPRHTRRTRNAPRPALTHPGLARWSVVPGSTRRSRSCCSATMGPASRACLSDSASPHVGAACATATALVNELAEAGSTKCGMSPRRARSWKPRSATPHLGSNRTGRPLGCVAWLYSRGHDNHRFRLHVAACARYATMWLVPQSVQPPFVETSSPLSWHDRIGAQVRADLNIRLTG